MGVDRWHHFHFKRTEGLDICTLAVKSSGSHFRLQKSQMNNGGKRKRKRIPSSMILAEKILEEVTEDRKCNICHGFSLSHALLPCKHHYCFDCIKRTLDADGSRPDANIEFTLRFTKADGLYFRVDYHCSTSPMIFSLKCPECRQPVATDTISIDLPDHICRSLSKWEKIERLSEHPHAKPRCSYCERRQETISAACNSMLLPCLYDYTKCKGVPACGRSLETKKVVMAHIKHCTAYTQCCMCFQMVRVSYLQYHFNNHITVVNQCLFKAASLTNCRDKEKKHQKYTANNCFALLRSRPRLRHLKTLDDLNCVGEKTENDLPDPEFPFVSVMKKACNWFLLNEAI